MLHLSESSMSFLKISQTSKCFELHCSWQMTRVPVWQGISRNFQGCSPRRPTEISPVKAKDTPWIVICLRQRLLYGDWSLSTEQTLISLSNLVPVNRYVLGKLHVSSRSRFFLASWETIIAITFLFGQLYTILITAYLSALPVSNHYSKLFWPIDQHPLEMFNKI